MFIKSLHLENWTSHADTKLDLERVTIIRGANGAGKSSIQQAIQFLLCGTAAATDERGSGSRDLIRSGEDKAVIEGAIIEDGKTRTLRCSLTEKSGRASTVKMEGDAGYTGTDYLESLRIWKDVLACLSNSAWFFDKKPADQKDLLASILLPATWEFNEKARAAAHDLGLKINWGAKPFDVIKEGYDAAFEERKIINRLIKEWRQPDAPIESENLAVIRDRLRKRQDERTTLAQERGKAVQKHERAVSDQKASAGKLEKVRTQLSQEHQAEKDAKADLLSKPQVKTITDAAGNAEKVGQVETQLQTTRAEIAALRRTITKVQEVGEANKCPTCTQTVTDEQYAAIEMPLHTQRMALETFEKGLLETRRLLGDPAGAQKMLDAHVAAEKHLRMITERLAELEKDFEALTQQTAETLPAAPNTSEIDAKIADIDARLEKGNAALQDAIRAEQQKQEYETAIEKKNQLDLKLGKLEKLVAYFGPKGVSMELLDKHVGPFEAAMNAVLAAWGYRCKLSFDPYSFEVGRGETLLQLRTISKSQRWAFAVAFQVALAKTTGVSFLMVDEADIFLEAQRRMLYSALIGAGLDQVIVAQSDLRREVPGMDGVAVYMMTLDESQSVPTCVCERLK